MTNAAVDAALPWFELPAVRRRTQARTAAIMKRWLSVRVLGPSPGGGSGGPPPGGAFGAPRPAGGRGRGSVMPAWMAKLSDEEKAKAMDNAKNLPGAAS